MGAQGSSFPHACFAVPPVGRARWLAGRHRWQRGPVLASRGLVSPPHPPRRACVAAAGGGGHGNRSLAPTPGAAVTATREQAIVTDYREVAADQVSPRSARRPLDEPPLPRTESRTCSRCGGTRVIFPLGREGASAPCPVCAGVDAAPGRHRRQGAERDSPRVRDLVQAMQDENDAWEDERDGRGLPGVPRDAKWRKRMQMGQRGVRRGPQSEEWRKKRAEALRRYHQRKKAEAAAQPSPASPARAKEPRHCSLCGQRGHNRRKCPRNVEAPVELRERRRQRAQRAEAVKAQEVLRRDLRKLHRSLERKAARAAALGMAPWQMDAVLAERGVQYLGRCTHCGGAGHKRRACPELLRTATGDSASATPSPWPPLPRSPSPRLANPGDLASPPDPEPVEPTAVPATPPPSSPVPPPPCLAGPASPWTASNRALDSLGRPIALPRTVEEQVTNATAAVLRAYRAGRSLQTVELLLPTPGLALRRVSEDAGFWAGGVQEQFKVALPMAQALLQNVKTHPDLSGRMMPSLVDEGDAVAAWANPSFAAVLFPAGDALPQTRGILRDRQLGLVINPQWVLEGNLISELGVGQAREENERFVASLGEETYFLAQKRVAGQVLRVFRCYPGPWMVFGFVEGGAGEEPLLLSTEESKPSYARLVDLARTMPDSGWFGRMVRHRPRLAG